MGGASDVPADNTPASVPDNSSDEMGNQIPPVQDGGIEDTSGDEEMPSDNAGENPEIPEGGDDSTMSIIDQLSDKDRDAVRAYAESLLNRSEAPNEGTQGEESTNQPIMETLKAKKNEWRRLVENFGPTQDEISVDSENNKSLAKKSKKSVVQDSPFNAPNFEKE